MKIFLDAGHGGHDPGATNGLRLEKTDVLNLVLNLGEELKKRGVEVFYSRKDDRFITLEDRCKNANKLNVDFFVSIHRNAAKAEAKGAETWVVTNALAPTINWATKINNVLSNYFLNRGVKKGMPGNKGDYYINRNSRMPSCLVEVGFISNVEDNNILDSKFNEIVMGLADALTESVVNSPSPQPIKPLDPIKPKPDTQQNLGFVTVKKGTWNIRKEPNNNGIVLKVVKGGSKLPYSNISIDGWYKITNVGYIHKNALSI
ncbi:MAG: N-acetylmuramoyl-L-alanine amidase [Oscillospiraceae bacterium]